MFDNKPDSVYRFKKVTRLEVIDHRGEGLGRVYGARPCSVAISVQDDGKTLKLFVTDPAPGIGAQG